MKYKVIAGCVLAVAITVVSAGVQPAVSSAMSLYDDGGRNIFADRKACQVGDIITIIINESSSTSTTKNSSNSKSGNQSLSAGTGVFHFLAAASAAQSDSFSANGSANSTNKANATVTVTVVDVQENGNLVVEGTQSIWQNKNENKITLRGIIRPDDVSVNNTVMSTRVSDAEVRFDGKGPLNAKQRQGIITQILNILF